MLLWSIWTLSKLDDGVIKRDRLYGIAFYLDHSYSEHLFLINDATRIFSNVDHMRAIDMNRYMHWHIDSRDMWL